MEDLIGTQHPDRHLTPAEAIAALEAAVPGLTYHRRTAPTPPGWARIVTVASRNLEWWHYSGGAVRFLAEWVSGTLKPWALPELGFGLKAFR
ncbi:hypothetical protein [Streptomyces acidiscabies]|uniref:Uncharacterized protein n=1 Tax=Streptomyces acidiscabies TaxID=42234 RepID=A0A0L0JKB6_9ACTN|nr:hypothetical protein [Streptomyces acidiscabies]KND25815.1 hypothetical protein IQ63_39555 [Streptomyces acidiscabies]